MTEAARERLVQELVALPEEERRAVVREARVRARVSGPTLPWASLRAAIGLAQGAAADAVEDCDGLYDG
ncbi:MAG: hypothetical protein HY744_11295 [Deltaproteobacteria bacterium]|nr:hypothetical protein [Deltaproteobacteria bacterium]